MSRLVVLRVEFGEAWRFQVGGDLHGSQYVQEAKCLEGWGGILVGRPPILSIEITRECPLDCPGCYAYGDAHLGGAVTLRELSDLRGDVLVEGILDLVRRQVHQSSSLDEGEQVAPRIERKESGPGASEVIPFAPALRSESNRSRC
jgi:hypothetical protein